jgi:hypothetical protein
MTDPRAEDLTHALFALHGSGERHGVDRLLDELVFDGDVDHGLHLRGDDRGREGRPRHPADLLDVHLSVVRVEHERFGAVRVRPPGRIVDRGDDALCAFTVGVDPTARSKPGGEEKRFGDRVERPADLAPRRGCG